MMYNFVKKSNCWGSLCGYFDLHSSYSRSSKVKIYFSLNKTNSKINSNYHAIQYSHS
jgi:hypothetical protein